MDGPRWERVKERFAAALELPASERDAFLLAEADAEIVAEVRTMLAAHARADGFLETPPGLAPPDLRGRRLGPYRIVATAGEGGMGTVYRAVRDDDVFQRTVAVKVVRGGGRELQRRFAEERRILGRLSHPNIAAIVDGGETDDGAAYLVMEFVDGVPIDVYCREQRLDLRARLELFRVVCRAVAYAHQNLIVHRDLKPSNILVTASGEPRLVDFGIAKLLSTEPTPTLSALPMMTPAYASPEQVRGEPVTTATDVYSLGLVLYELLTEIRVQPSESPSLEEVVRQVCETEPLPPSLAAKRPALAGDLDTIVLEALRKEPRRRYPSVDALAEDVRRHLVGLPVSARPDSFGYRAGKFVGRHRGAVIAVALVVVALVGGGIATLRQAHIAEVERARADRRFGEVRELARAFLVDVDGEIRHLAGATQARQKIVEKGLGYLDRLRQEAAGDPDLLAELADGYRRIGDIRGNPDFPNLGDDAGARASYDLAVTSAREALARQPDHLAARQALWGALQQRATLEIRLVGVSEGRRLLREALEVVDGSIAAHPDDAALARDRTVTLGFLARLELQAGDRAAAERLYREVREACLAFRRAHPEHPEAARDVFISELELVVLFLDGDQAVQAIEPAQRALVLADEAHGKSPETGQTRRDVATALHFVSRAFLRAERPAEAVPHLVRAVAITRALATADPADVLARRDLAGNLLTLGQALTDVRRFDEALVPIRESVAITEALSAAQPDERQFKTDVASALHALGKVELALGRRADAVQTLERASRLQTATASADPDDAAAQKLTEEIGATLAGAR
jgi:eukaryotic-like serine/threonine-protein kinase